MQTPVSLKSAERKVFQTTFADGLWDIFIGCFALEFAIAPLLSASLGDFWSSVIFLPFLGLVYLAIWLARKYVIKPRIGLVSFGKARKDKLRKFSAIMVVINILVFILGILTAFTFGKISGGGSVAQFGTFISFFLGLFLLAGFSIAAYLLDYPRLYIYGLLLFAAPPIGEWLFQNHGATHHGYPIVFGFTAGVMILTGLVLFVRLLKNNPLIGTPEEED
jgi:hypothetical protein